MRKVAILVAVVAMAVAFSAPSAMATSLDFGCGGGAGIVTACTGTVVSGGGNFSSTGIGVFTGADPGDPFTLIFNTANTGSFDSIEIDEFGSPDLVGTITGFVGVPGSGNTAVVLSGNFSVIPADLGGGTGVIDPLGFVIYINANGNALSVDIPITAPEPTTLGLLTAGFAGLGLLRKRKVA